MIKHSRTLKYSSTRIELEGTAVNSITFSNALGHFLMGFGLLVTVVNARRHPPEVRRERCLHPEERRLAQRERLQDPGGHPAAVGGEHGGVARVPPREQHALLLRAT